MYISTRGGVNPVTASEAIYRGLAPDGGLFVPESFPTFPISQWLRLPDMDYGELAKIILGLYLDDYSEEEIEAAVDAAYGDNFDCPEKTPLINMTDHRYLLELWHGPTAAFKDMALQILPYLLTDAMKKQGVQEEVVILVATSGDTGKAALEGFADVPGTRVIVFYPEDGVSEVQRLQMVTTAGDNTSVVAVRGNFDDCQRGVKDIFNDDEFRADLAKDGFLFSSANSINWGRLLPQIVYYFKAYGVLVKDGVLPIGDHMDVVVPTGNFGNILACYYAIRMGLPVRNLICASNKNRVLTDVIERGLYDRQRQFYRTMSPSMDILVSSNFERFVFEMTDRNAGKVRELFTRLDEKGFYYLDWQSLTALQKAIRGYSCDEEDTALAIRHTFAEENLLIDPHTAVAIDALEQFRITEDSTRCPAVIVSTANPYKFNVDVYEALKGQGSAEDHSEFEISILLSELSDIPPHIAVKNLESKEIRHDLSIEKEDMAEAVRNILKNSKK